MQLDSISAVERSHRITLASRVGAYPKGTVPGLLRSGRVFEFCGEARLAGLGTPADGVAGVRRTLGREALGLGAPWCPGNAPGAGFFAEGLP